jgi:chromosomal replication initiator protein
MINYFIAPALPKKVLKDFSQYKVNFINDKVCEYLKIDDVEKLKSKTHKRYICEARQIAMTIMKEKTKMSLKDIGIFFGGRDHSTVIHAKRTVLNLCETNKVFRKKFLDIEKIINEEMF